MKAYFDITEPYYLSREPTFGGVPVEVPSWVLDMLDDRKATLAKVDEQIHQSSAPEESAQDLCDFFVELLEAENGKE